MLTRRCVTPDRESFNPDAAHYIGSNSGMCCFQGAPRLAVEVRSEGDKRADCFAAATEVVSDVDLVGEDTVCMYTAVSPTVPGVFRRGQSADAAPAVPGWSMPVDDLFE